MNLQARANASLFFFRINYLVFLPTIYGYKNNNVSLDFEETCEG